MFYDNTDSPYKRHSMHPDDRRMLDTLTEPKSWNSANFHQILVSIGTLGNGVIAAGWAATGGAYGGDPIRFNSSIQVNVCSNVSTDTNGLYVVYTYNKTAS